MISLEQMHEAGKPFLAENFFEDQSQAAQQFGVYSRGGQFMQLKIKVIAEFLAETHFPMFIASLTVTGLCILLYLTSFVVIACILWKGERKYKNIAHLGWITSMFTFVMSIMFVFVFCISVIIANDTCSMYKEVNAKKSTASFVNMWPEDLSPIID